MSTEQFLKNATKRLKKNSETKEIDIEDQFCKHAKSKGCSALKLILLNRRSFPDRTVICPGGKVFFIEFKKQGKSQTEGQKKWQVRLESLGFEYYVCDRKGQAESLLDEFLAFNS